jgi:hypothetical protein
MLPYSMHLFFVVSTLSWCIYRQILYNLVKLYSSLFSRSMKKETAASVMCHRQLPLQSLQQYASH